MRFSARLFIVLVLALAACDSAQLPPPPAAQRPVRDGPPPPAQIQGELSEPVDVSIVQLIATPERFDGKMIRVIGFLHLEFEGNALYLHETDFCHSISANAVWVAVGWPPKDEQMARSNSYVLLEGRFDAQSKGHFGMFSGSIRDVSRLNGWNVDAESRRCDPRLYNRTAPQPPPPPRR